MHSTFAVLTRSRARPPHRRLGGGTPPLVAVAALLCAQLVLDSGGRAAAATGPLAFAPVADAYVSESSPYSSELGSYPYLVVSASPVRQAYVKFQLSGLDGRPSAAKLRLYVTKGSPGGWAVAPMRDTAWTEAVTWSSKPAIDGPVVATLGPVAAGQWYELDVTPAVAGDGLLSLSLTHATGAASDAAVLASRQDAPHSPQLVVTTGSRAVTPTPTPGPTARVYYVSPSGSDANPGTQAQPWRSFYKAAATLRAGETALFEDGVYEETQYRPHSAFANSGTSAAPITVRARNKHRAVVRFHGRPEESKIWILDNDWVVVQDFEITQAQRGTTYADVLLRCWYRDLGNGQVKAADHCRILGNYFHNAYEPVKTTLAQDVVFDGNVVADAQVGFGSVQGGPGVIVRNNEFVNPVDSAIQTKGGTVDAQVYNNVVRTTGGHTTTVGIYVGGNGYESRNNVAYNNVVVSEVQNAIAKGIVLQGCHDCAVYNNVVVGAEVGFQSFQGNLGSQAYKGDDNYLYTVNPRLLNNIVQGAWYGLLWDPAHTRGAVQVDHNLFEGVADRIPAQAHPVWGSARFVDRLRDWRLGAGSAALGSGTVVTHTGHGGQAVDVSRDRNGAPRASPWDLGIYAY